MKNNMLLKNIYKIALFSLPISSGMLISMISNFIAMLMVAKISKLELAAGAVSVSSYITIMTIFVTMFYAIGILVSHLKGKVNGITQIGQMVKNGLWLASILAIPSGIALWNIDKVLLLFKLDSQLVAIARNYFHFAAFSMLPTLIGTVISQFFSGIGKPRFSAIVSTVSLPVMVFLSYGFVLGHFGLPKLGLAGVSCATLIAQFVIYGCIIIYMHLTGIIKKYKIFSGRVGISWILCKKILFLGAPIGIQFGAEIGALTVATYMLGHFGVTALAASQVVQQYILLAVMITLGLSQAISILISQEYAKNNIEQIKQYIEAAMVILCVMSIFVVSLFWFAPNWLLKFYMNSESLKDLELISLAKKLFAIAAITIFADGIRNILSGCLRGMRDSKLPMKISIICLWGISLPLSYFAGLYFHGGAVGLRLGFLFGFIVAAILLWQKLQSKIKTEVFANKIAVQFN